MKNINKIIAISFLVIASYSTNLFAEDKLLRKLSIYLNQQFLMKNLYMSQIYQSSI